MNVAQRLAKLETEERKKAASVPTRPTWNAEKMRQTALEASEILKSLGYAKGPQA